jgi:ABC-2 type transport system permease protein
VIGALGQPILFWILFGAGLGGSFKNPAWVPAGMNMTYQEYFFPGVVVMILMFTAIFSTISIIEDRREGFLQGVLVAPIPRSALVFGKLFGGTALAVVQTALFFAVGPVLALVGLAPEFEFPMGILGGLATAGFVTLLAFTLTALGYVIAWPMDSTQGFHAIMSVFLMPMWLLSGAFFPGEGSRWLSWVVALNPLTYGVAGLRRLLYFGVDLPETAGLPGLGSCVLVSGLFGCACVGAAVWLTARQSSNNAR